MTLDEIAKAIEANELTNPRIVFEKLEPLARWALTAREALEEIRQENEQFAESAIMNWEGVQDLAYRALAAFPGGVKP